MSVVTVTNFAFGGSGDKAQTLPLGTRARFSLGPIPDKPPSKTIWFGGKMILKVVVV